MPASYFVSDYKPPIKVNFYHDVNKIANQGVIEVTLYNRSGSVCSKSFGKQEATVMCRMLGFHG